LVKDGIGVGLGTVVELGRNVAEGCGVGLVRNSESAALKERSVLTSVTTSGISAPNSACATDSPAQPLNRSAPMHTNIMIGSNDFRIA
jgi:hypothetical protein